MEIIGGKLCERVLFPSMYTFLYICLYVIHVHIEANMDIKYKVEMCYLPMASPTGPTTATSAKPSNRAPTASSWCQFLPL